MINSYRHELPLIVMRDSVIIHSITDPVPGWFDNFNGPMGEYLKTIAQNIYEKFIFYIFV